MSQFLHANSNNNKSQGYSNISGFLKKTVKLKNGGKFSKRVKNTVGKEKLLTTAEYHNKTFSSITKIQYAQFLLLINVFEIMLKLAR